MCFKVVEEFWRGWDVVTCQKLGLCFHWQPRPGFRSASDRDDTTGRYCGELDGEGGLPTLSTPLTRADSRTSVFEYFNLVDRWIQLLGTKPT